MKTILVTGSKGQLGSELNDLTSFYPFQFIFTDVNELDITSAQAITAFIQNHSIHYCINAAAYTAVDKAETDQEMAFLINAKAAENLAFVCAKSNIPIIHISTDFVLDGRLHTPYNENAKGNPVSVYGKSKLEGERLVSAANKKAIIIRTSWLYSYYGKNFVKTMLQLSKDRDSLGVVSDQVGTPTYARDLAKVILEIILQIDHAKDPNPYFGLYNYSNEGIASWFDFAKLIFEFSNTKINVKPIQTSEYPTPAKRPAYSVLNKSKIKSTFNLSIPTWQESLAECIEKLTK